MASEYDPIGSRSGDPLVEESLDRVRALFEDAGRPYLSRPWSWLAWSLILPVAALSTRSVLASTGAIGALLLWSVAVIVGGLIEASQIYRSMHRAGQRRSTLASWVLRAQGNLSLVGLLVSIVLVLQGMAWLLPGVWLLLLGHSLFGIGGLGSRALQTAGLLYQLGGLLAIWPHGRGLEVFAVATGVANAWVAWSIWRGVSQSRSADRPGSVRSSG